MRHANVTRGWVGLMAMALLAPLQAQADERTDERAAMLAEVRRILEAEDSLAAAAWVERKGTPREVAQRYMELAFDLHWKAKDLQACLQMGHLGLHHVLAEARAVAGSDTATAQALTRAAQQLSFNLASFAWPGWNEAALRIGETELAFGLQMARLDARLVAELGDGPDKHSVARWILGAQLLAAGRHEEALRELETSRQKAKEAGREDGAHMVRGYLGIVRVLMGGDESETGRAEVAAAVRHLDEIATDDATFYARQLEDVLAFFTGKDGPWRRGR